MNTRRSGAALIWALVVLSVLGITSAVAVREFATARRTIAIHQNRIQAEWLARAGAELAVARLLADDNYIGETIEPIPNAPVRITIERDKAKSDTYRIKCDATFPTGDYRAVNTQLNRTATRRIDGGKVTIELSAGSDEPPAP
jgi:type II secretory pathway pseudopilin PulG